ncbi:hypothetical protein BC832DRAFT_240754 [Gaertneriomyces semiglobifer]|nr:hypothetical protein BC832DRAFT_240754 [Gaertneriomyces semiglobifer]
MRNVAESPGTVKIEAAPDQLSDLEEMTPYYTFTENIYGVNTYLEFTGINISLARNTSFGVRLEGTNTILNITDCIVEGELDDVGGSNSHVYFRVGAIDSAIPARPAHFHSYRTTYKDTRLVTTLYGMTSGVVKGGSAMGMHTRTGSVLRGNFGSLLVEDFDFIGAPTLQHYSALIALQMSNGKDTPEFQTGGLTLKNVKFEGNMLREHLVRLEIGNSKFTDVTIAGNMAVGPDPTNDMSVNTSHHIWRRRD